MVANHLPWRSSANKIENMLRRTTHTVAMMVKANMVCHSPPMYLNLHQLRR